MWIDFPSCRMTTKNSRFYFKLITLSILFFQNPIRQSECFELVHGIGSFCNSNNDCDQNRFLQCNNTNTCECQNNLIWVAEKYSCMTMEDAPCDSLQSSDQPNCIINSSCIAGICQCDDGFLRSGFGTCELSYGYACSENEKCASRYLLECAKNSRSMYSAECRCKSEGVVYVWDEYKQKCVSTVGGTCHRPGSPSYGKDDQQECIENANCVVGTNSNYMGICQCHDGFAETAEGTCMLKLGESCDPYSGPKCNRHQFLVCREEEKKCACALYGQMKFDVEANQCRFLVGESCDIRNKSGNYNDNSEMNVIYANCITDSFCKPPQKSSSHRGECTCLQGLEKTSKRVCSRYNKGHGLPCSTSIDCDRERFLECVLDENVGSRCDCFQNDMYFDGKQCRVYPGKSCTHNKLCGNNSHCDGDWCICDVGYDIKIGETGCIKKGRNKPRNSVDDDVNQDQTTIAPTFSGCEGMLPETLDWTRCHCQSKFISHAWVPENQACLSLVGTSCQRDEECVPNAICDEQAKTCQCSSGMYTTSERTCVCSRVQQDPTNHDCNEVHTSKSIGSGSVSDDSNGYTAFMVFLAILGVTAVFIVILFFVVYKKYITVNNTVYI